MMTIRSLTSMVLLGLMLVSSPRSQAAREPAQTLVLWPGVPPGETPATGPEIKVPKRPRPFYQLTQIATPTLQVFLPAPEKHLGTGVLVCPGGGLQRLAYEHEGLEVASWLNELGITAFVLKYRVPAPAKSGAMDAQRAISLMRTQADHWRIDPTSIGFIGFSAGGEIGAWLSTQQEERLYAAIDTSDTFSCRPDFVAMIYSGGLLQGWNGPVKSSLLEKFSPTMPPTFLAHAFNDGCQNSLQWALALKQARVPCELHLFQEGGHGFGARTTGIPVDDWKNRFAEWTTSQNHLLPWFLKQYRNHFIQSLQSSSPPPILTHFYTEASLDQAYAVQRAIAHRLAIHDPLGGFKGAAASAGAQKNLKVEGPLAGVLFKSGQIPFKADTLIPVPATYPLAIETEIAYKIGVDLSYEVLNDLQAREIVQAILPAIELPRSSGWTSENVTAPNIVASNIGSDRYIFGAEQDPSLIDPDTLEIVLKKDGNELHRTRGETAHGGQYHNLRKILNQLTAAGYTLPAGSIIISGALGAIHPGTPGTYEANFGTLGTIQFRLESK